MRPVRFVANILFYVSRIGAFLFLATGLYALIVVLLSSYSKSLALPIEIEGGYFRIFYPFTKKTFLLGDYTVSYLVTNLFTIGFYGIFLWLLSQVFNAFRQKKIFTRKGVARLSRFYITNLVMPFLFLLLLVFFNEEFSDIIRIIFLHVVIGVFAFFYGSHF